MASETSHIQIGKYAINPRGVIGKGSFGIVFTATDPEEEVVVAKRIDVSDPRRAEKITKDLDKLLELKHPNIVHFFEITREQNLLWIFMEYCPHGDLNKLFTEARMTEEDTMLGMTQMADGLAYLHRNNIVHRDIKPANILVANTIPLKLKLTDFDLSKFFEEDYETSKMSSNVGTAAFKAPEFFLRNDQKKLEYHRSVDIYALGLTLLAMVQGNQPLVPQLETARHDSEIHNPIGSTIATRLSYGLKPLTVINSENDSSLSLNGKKAAKAVTPSVCEDKEHKNNTAFARVLILEMTNIEPKKRLTAAEVHLTLLNRTLGFIKKGTKKTKEIHVGNYTVDAAAVFSLGHRSEIYSARNSEHRTISAKKIDMRQAKEDHQQIVKALQKSQKLDHPNILKYFEVVTEGNVNWLFMELCPQLDFENFFASTYLTESEALEAMVQMARGIEYLHSMGVVHRDVQPANILVANVSPLSLKLVDFVPNDDFNWRKKGSDPPPKPTKDFKAPEFFMQNDERKFEHQPGVDIYSLGLIFLAMIQGNEFLVPMLETTRRDVGPWSSIGSIMAYRLERRRKPLTVIPVEGKISFARKLLRTLRLKKVRTSSSSNRSKFENHLRDLIQKMTRIEAEERLTASEVVQSLLQFTQRAPTCVTLTQRTRWNSDLGQISMCVNSRDQLILRGRTDDKRVIKVCDRHTGKVLKEVDSVCNHYSDINEVPENPDCLLEACAECSTVRLCNLKKNSSNTVLDTIEPWRLCTKSKKLFFITNQKGFVHEIQLEAKEGKMEIIGATKVEAQNILRMCCDSYADLLIVSEKTNDEQGRVQAFHLGRENRVWEFTGEVDGKPFFPRGMCCDNKGLVFVGDHDNKRLLVLNSSSGDLLQIIPVDMDIIWKIEWSEKTSELTVLHGPQIVSCFSVKESPDEK